MKKIGSKLKQSGFTLLEILVALVIMSAMGAGVVAYKKMELDDQKASVAAGHLNAVSKAANAYIKDNYSAIMGIATANKPVLIRVSDLVSEKYLKPNTSSTNPYQQDACALVLQPTPGQLTGMVVTQGGTSLSDATLSSIVARAGASSGGIYTDKPDAIIGARGGWAVNHTAYNSANHLGQNCSGASGSINLEPGHPAVALWFENNDLTAGFLYREEIPGRPELNRMATSIDMDGHDINNAGTVEARNAFAMDGTTIIDADKNIVNVEDIIAKGKLEAETLKPTLVVTEGSACSENSLIATDSKGQILSCQNGSWKGGGGSSASLATNGYWKDEKTGLIMQWGRIGWHGAKISTSATFAIPFPNAALSGSINDSGTGGWTIQPTVRSLTRTQITSYGDYRGTGFYIAIGY